MKKELITHSELLKYCKYDPETGVFRNNSTGMRIGFADTNNGHRAIFIDGKKYQETRLAVLYVTGKWPTVRVRNNNTRKYMNTKFRYLDFSHKPYDKEVKHVGFTRQISNAFAGFFGVQR